jgi:CHAD domain-containing protein
MSIYYINPDTDVKAIIDALYNEFVCTDEHQYKAIRHYYDSFDWRLYQKKIVLYSDAKRYTLLNKKTHENTYTTGLSKEPVFIQDFPPTAKLTKILKPVLQMRALCRKNTVHIASKKIRVLNKTKKTTIYIVLETCRIKRNEKFMIIKVIPLRGYEKESRKMLKWLSQYNFEEIQKDLLDLLYEFGEEKPGSYTSKLKIQLDPDSSVPESAKYIHKELLNIMQINKNGIIKDIDTEFLHDFRVSVRRTRSLYGHLKNELPEKIIKQAKKDFSALGQLTNRLRDIDVYLLNTNMYFSFMPDDMAGYLKPFFDKMENERISEHKKVARFLKSKRYTDMIGFWTDIVNTPEQITEPVHHIIEFARTQIMIRLERVLRLGGKINSTSPDSMLHKLRIECKKLRYLLEFYSSLFPPVLISTLIRQLKILQDYLGEFNDYSVQQEKLHKYIDHLNSVDQENKRTITAVGFLIGKLNQRQMEVRKNFAKTFKKFSGPETKKVFSQLKLADKL